MCFKISSNPEFRKVRIAEKNIFVYKILNRFNKDNTIGQSLIQSFIYTVGGTYSIKKFTKIRREIAQGFHSWNSKGKNRRSIVGTRRVCKFIIPKGTKYYFNPMRNEYVSLAIKFKSIVSKTN